MNAEASRSTITFLAALTAAMFAWIAAGTATALAAAPSQLPASASKVTYPTNATGQTYGAAAGVPPSQEPDLILAIGTGSDGTPVTGYLVKSQLDVATGANVQSPQQSAIWMQTRPHAGAIPLYAQDGKTVVGQFTIMADQNVPDTFTQTCGTKGRFGPIDGYSYNNYSCIAFSTGSAGSYGSVMTEADNYVNVPPGYMGALPRVFSASGALCIEGSWVYNPGSSNGIEAAAYRPAAYCGSGYYYSSGESRVYNGNGYDTYTSFNSPNLYL